MARIIGSTVATASHHLRFLRKMGIAKSRKEGKLMFYSLQDDKIQQLIQTIDRKQYASAKEPVPG